MASFASTFEDQLTDGIIWSRTLVFSNYPSHRNFQLPEFEGGSHSMQIINYSQLYNEFVVDNPSSKSNYAKSLIHPNKIQTGDILQTADYRGVGSYYAVWLHADVFQNPASLCLQRASKVPRSENPVQDDDESDQPKEDLDQFHLDALTWGKIRDLCTNYSFTEEKLIPLLQEKCPALLEKLTNETTKYDLQEAIGAMRFQGDPGSCGVGEGVDWDDLPTDELFQDGQTQSAGEYFLNLPRISFPILKKPSELAAAMKSHSFMQLYLFEHLDEMGYDAPPAVSIAPIGYFESEYKERCVDLALLPPPLDTQTTLGFVLNKIRDNFPEDGLDNEEDEAEEDEEDEEGDEEEEDVEDDDENEESHGGHNKKRKNQGKQSSATKKEKIHEPTDPRKKYELAIIDFEGEDAISWCTVKNSKNFVDVYPAGENPIIATRRMFHKHAKEIRQKLLALRQGSSGAVSDEELNSLFDQLLWT
jgi:hypothetical protein